MIRLLVLAAGAVLLAACSSPAEIREPAQLDCVGCGEARTIDLGEAPAGASASTTVVLRNMGDEPVTLQTRTQARSLEPFRSNLSCDPGCPSRTLGPGEELEVAVALRPPRAGRYEASLDLGGIVLQLRGAGTKPAISCSEPIVDFGEVVLGESRQAAIRCSNGSAVPVSVRLEGPDGLDAGNFQVSVASATGRTFDIPASGERTLDVSFVPSQEGPSSSQLLLVAGEERVATALLEGRGVEAWAIDAEVGEGGCLDFGEVEPGASRERVVALRNRSAEPRTLDGAGAAGDFSASAERLGLVAPGESVAIPVRFTPTAEGRREATLQLSTSSPGAQPSLCLRGTGGGPRLVCDPARLEFGPVAVGASRTLALPCRNEGRSPLVIEGFDAGASFRAALRDPAPTYAAGAAFVVDVTVDPAFDGVVEDVLHVRSNDGGLGTTDIPVAALGRAVPACDLSHAAILDFGNVAGRPSTLELVVANEGATACTLFDLRLSGPGFSPTGGALPATVEIPPHAEVGLPIDFRPDGEPAGGTLRFWAHRGAGAPADTVVPLRAVSDASCLVSAGATFTAIEGLCEPPSASVRLWSRCVEKQLIESIDVVGPFEIGAAPLGELVRSVELPVTWRPTSGEKDDGGLLVKLAGEPAPYFVPLRGELRKSAERIELFGGRPIDLLVIGDNSGSPTWNFILPDRGAQFFGAARAAGVDFQVGLTTTGISPSSGCPGGVDGGEDGRLFPVDHSLPRILRSSLPPAEQDALWLGISSVGICHGSELGLEASLRALSAPLVDRLDDPRHPEPEDGNAGLIRQEADLSVLYVSDEDDQSPWEAALYTDFLRRVKGPDRAVRAHAMVGDEGRGCNNAQAGDRYHAAVRATGGHAESICTLEYDDAAARLGAAVFSAGKCLILGQTALDPDGAGLALPELEVRRNGQIVPSWSWSYEPARNAVCFREDLPPEPGQTIEIRYTGTCSVR